MVPGLTGSSLLSLRDPNFIGSRSRNTGVSLNKVQACYITQRTKVLAHGFSVFPEHVRYLLALDRPFGLEWRPTVRMTLFNSLLCTQLGRPNIGVTE